MWTSSTVMWLAAIIGLFVCCVATVLISLLPPTEKELQEPPPLVFGYRYAERIGQWLQRTCAELWKVMLRMVVYFLRGPERRAEADQEGKQPNNISPPMRMTITLETLYDARQSKKLSPGAEMHEGQRTIHQL